MTSPTSPNRPPQPPRGWTVGTTLAVLLVPALVASVGCLGLCGGVLFLARHRIRSMVERAGIDIRDVIPEPATDWQDWMVRRELTHLYQTALESVDSDTALKEKLGEPMEAVSDTDDLFRRRDKGRLNLSGEHLEFDIQGPKGSGKVAVDSTPKQADGIQPAQIIVTLKDGSRLGVQPLHRPLPAVR
jgi:hypothetical protein